MKLKDWKPEDVNEIVVNPIYTGIGLFPKIIDDEVWIKAAKQAIRDMGHEGFFTAMLEALRKSFE